jgi:hypothetical protein
MRTKAVSAGGKAAIGLDRRRGAAYCGAHMMEPVLRKSVTQVLSIGTTVEVGHLPLISALRVRQQHPQQET